MHLLSRQAQLVRFRLGNQRRSCRIGGRHCRISCHSAMGRHHPRVVRRHLVFAPLLHTTVTLCIILCSSYELASLALVRAGIDDPVNASPVHLVGGLIGEPMRTVWRKRLHLSPCRHGGQSQSGSCLTIRVCRHHRRRILRRPRVCLRYLPKGDTGAAATIPMACPGRSFSRFAGRRRPRLLRRHQWLRIRHRAADCRLHRVCRLGCR